MPGPFVSGLLLLGLSAAICLLAGRGKPATSFPMPYLETVTDLSPENLARYDAIIDVRSPAEFADDHMPGAISLAVLSNDERARVGTIYKQELSLIHI